jgi:DNA-binding response OmpR family regulator
MTFKILTVDDSRTIRMIVKKAFQNYNCDLFEAENGQEGLALAAREKPDLIVLDITMPVMTGVEMLAQLKADETLNLIPVIMLTAESGKDNVVNIVKMGVKDYIVKPFKGEQLIERARHLIDLKRNTAIADPAERVQPEHCFGTDKDLLILTLPAKISRSQGAQIASLANEKFAQMNAAWTSKLVIDLTAVADINMTLIQLIIALLQGCSRGKIPARVVATQVQAGALKGFQETGAIETVLTLEQARAGLSA